jgi:hypothetical protein
MMNDDDQELQRRIDAWSAQEKQAAPDFDRVWRQAARVAEAANANAGGLRSWPGVAVIAALVTLGAVSIWWLESGREGAWHEQLAAAEIELGALPGSEATAPEWTGPTDFLLAATPGETLHFLQP